MRLCLILSVALMFFFSIATSQHALQGAFAYTRWGLQNGELWRAWTGHWTHYDSAHFAADWIVLLPCLLVLALRRSVLPLSLLIVIVPLALSAAFYALAPNMLRYQGASGVSCAALAWLAMLLRKTPRHSSVGHTMLVVLSIKVALDAFGLWPNVMATPDVHAVSLAHVGGLLLGSIGGACFASKNFQ